MSSMRDSAPSLSVAPDTELARFRGVAAPATAWRVVVPLSGVVFLGMLPVTLIVPALKKLLVDRFAASPFWPHAFMSINLIGGITAGSLGFLCGPLLGGILATVLAGTLPLAQIYAVTFVLAGATECIGALVSLPFCSPYAATGKRDHAGRHHRADRSIRAPSASAGLATLNDKPSLALGPRMSHGARKRIRHTQDVISVAGESRHPR